MLYVKQTWVNGRNGTPVNATRLQHLEDGVETLEAGLSGTYALPLKQTVIMFGTSITLLSGPGPSTLDTVDACKARGYWTWAAGYLGQRLGYVKNAGVGGDTTALMLARIQADVLAYASDWVIIEAGVNDVASDVPLATIQANLTSILDLLKAAGRRVVLLTANPSTSYSTTGRKTVLAGLNKWIMALPTARANLVVVDTWRTVVDPATGFPATGMTVDGVHPSVVGAQRMGKAVADVLAPLIAARPPALTTLTDPKNVLGNPSFTSGTGWAGAGTGITVTYPVLTDTWGSKASEALAGITDDSERHTTYIENISGGRLVAGQIVQASVRVTWSALTAAQATISYFEPFVRLMPRQVGGAFTTETYAMQHASADRQILNGFAASGDMVLLTPRLTFPVGCDRLYVAVGWRGAGSGTVEYRDLSLAFE